MSSGSRILSRAPSGVSLPPRLRIRQQDLNGSRSKGRKTFSPRLLHRRKKTDAPRWRGVRRTDNSALNRFLQGAGWSRSTTSSSRSRTSGRGSTPLDRAAAIFTPSKR
jgi:hypothetical protein